jgi:hypothetical protein
MVRSTHFCSNDGGQMAGNATATTTLAPDVAADILDSIKWPYWIVAIGHIAYSFGYIAVNYLPYKMPSMNF